MDVKLLSLIFYKTAWLIIDKLSKLLPFKYNTIFLFNICKIKNSSQVGVTKLSALKTMPF